MLFSHIELFLLIFLLKNLINIQHLGTVLCTYERQ